MKKGDENTTSKTRVQPTQKDRLYHLFTLHTAIISCYEEKFKPTLESRSIQSSQINTATFLLVSKCIKTSRAISILCHPVTGGYGEDALTLCRSVLEAYISLAYLRIGDSKQKAEQFLIFNDIDLHKRLKKFLEREDMSEDMKLEYKKKLCFIESRGLTQKQIAREKYRKVLKENRLPMDNSWSSLKIQSLAQENGLLFYYENLYYQLSLYAHPHPSGLAGFLDSSPDNSTFNDSPTYKGIKLALITNCDLLIKITTLLNKEYNLKMERELENFNWKIGTIASGQLEK